jgi:RNA polymerase sigma-70 factor (ECF subfamily)
VTAAAAMTDPDDSHLLLATIRAVRAGDSDAFEDLMIATERRVAALAWRILGDAEDVKDAVQETFIRVYRHLDQFREDGAFFGWLFRIAVNVCRDLERKRMWRRIFSPLEDAVNVGTRARFDDALEARDSLMRAIRRLPRQQRVAVILRDVEELSTEEVAAILGIRETSLKVSISKARAKMRKWMEER